MASSASERVPISNRTKAAFFQPYGLLHTAKSFRYPSILSQVRDEFGRLSLWALNAGALAADINLSLDHRTK